jgi:hypothetical protein
MRGFRLLALTSRQSGPVQSYTGGVGPGSETVSLEIAAVKFCGELDAFDNTAQDQRLAEVAVVDQVGRNLAIDVHAGIEVGAVLGRRLVTAERNILIGARVEICERSGNTGFVPPLRGAAVVLVNRAILAGAASTNTGGVK